MKVSKMHGARNDFIVVDARANDTGDLVAFARWACDRHAGIGADGVIALEPSSVADARMRTINPDGSEAEMCGNGVRCAARWLHETEARARATFETPAGPIRTEVVAREPEYAIRVAMGQPIISQITLASQEPAWFVDLGNPHVVLFRKNLDNVDIVTLALQIQSGAAFPNGANVHVATVLEGGALRVVHWERGAGVTMACGTGAVACAAVAIRQGRATSPVDVFVPGGRLVVEWDGRGEAYLVGPAVRVFDTEVEVCDGRAS